MNEADGVITQHSRSFSLASKLLPRRVRADVVAMYAWCRCVDDAVDEAGSTDEAIRLLSELKADVQRIADGHPTIHPASNWLRPLIVERGVDPLHAIELIEGMELDATGFRVQTFGDLRRYCYHAAGTVGLMMIRLMGVDDLAARQPAIALGVAMQMTNIVRDVREDAHRGRSYLPGIAEPLNESSEHVGSVCRTIIRIAEKEYDLAIQGLRLLPKDCQSAIELALVFYREIHREVIRQDFPVLERRTVVPKHRLLRLAIPVVIKNLLSVPFSFIQEKNMNTSSNRPSSAESLSAVSDRHQAWHAVYLGVSLTAIMASVLFVLVYVNPKEEAYGILPLIYCGVSLAIAVVTNRLAARCEAKFGTD